VWQFRAVCTIIKGEMDGSSSSNFKGGSAHDTAIARKAVEGLKGVRRLMPVQFPSAIDGYEPISVHHQGGQGIVYTANQRCNDDCIGVSCCGSAERQVLIRFDDIIGLGSNQIPPGSTNVSAALNIDTCNLIGTAWIQIHQLLQPWDCPGTTWGNSFGGNGVQPDGIEAVTTFDGGLGGDVSGIITLDVTESAQAWVEDPSSNHGLAIIPQQNNKPFEGWTYYSCSHPAPPIVAYLTIAFTPPPGAIPTTSAWGLAVMALVIVGAGTLAFRWMVVAT
jgi:hypothetical protein